VLCVTLNRQELSLKCVRWIRVCSSLGHHENAQSYQIGTIADKQIFSINQVCWEEGSCQEAAEIWEANLQKYCKYSRNVIFMFCFQIHL
jgi:hypothetical protein